MTTKRKRAAKKSAAAKKKTAPATPKTKPARGLSEAQFKKIALAFPGTSEGSSYGSPAILLLKKFFTRLRKEDNSAVLIVGSIDERDMMIEADPATFHITDHYKNYPDVLARLERLDAETLHGLLEQRWRAVAPKKLQKDAAFSKK
jgi:hypothetical protein